MLESDLSVEPLLGGQEPSRGRMDAQAVLQELERMHGSLQAGDPFPSQRELLEKFATSERIVRGALSEFEKQGRIIRRVGRGGTIVVKESEARPFEFNGEEDILNQDGVLPAKSLNAWIMVQMEPFETSIDPASESWPQRIVSRLEYLITSQGGRAKVVLAHTLNEGQSETAWQRALADEVNCFFYLGNEANHLGDLWTERFVQRQLGLGWEGQEKKTPVFVQISLGEKRNPYFDTVSFSGEWGSYMATVHLLGLGHRKIAFLAPEIDRDWLSLRIRGFHRALRGHGIEVPRGDEEFGVLRLPCTISTPDMWQRLAEDHANQLGRETDYTAVLLTNDHMAMSFIHRMEELGHQVPETLSVVGFDDRFDSVMQGLTTVHPPVEEIAGTTLELALKRRANPTRPEQIHLLLKPTLMVRNTTSRLA